MPDILDPVGILTLSNRGLQFPASEAKRLYLQAKGLRKTAARVKFSHFSVGVHYRSIEKSELLKVQVNRRRQTFFVAKVFSLLSPSKESVIEQFQETPSEMPISFRQLLGKLRSELSAQTFHQVKVLIRREGIDTRIAPKPGRGAKFISQAMKLDLRGHTDAALDLIYDSVDKLMREGRFEQLDSILSQVPVREITTDVLLGLLTASLPARTRLHARKSLYAQAEQALKERGEYEPGLLTGLE